MKGDTYLNGSWFNNSSLFREVFNLSEGGQLALDWYKVKEIKKKTIVLVLQGDTCFTSGLAKQLAQQFATEGHVCVYMHYRGCVGLKLTSPKLTSFGDFEDLAQVISHVKNTGSRISRESNSSLGSQEDSKTDKLFAIGISKGGYLLTRYLIERGEKDIRPTT